MGVIIWKLDWQQPMQSVPITTKVVSFYPAHGEVYSIQHYVTSLTVTYGMSVVQVCQ